MEALDLLKETQRMCRSTECRLNCPVSGVCFLRNYDVMSEDDMQTFVSSVEVWSKKNPPKTNAQKFKEVFGDEAIYAISSPNVQALKDWLDEPYKEPEHEL